MTTAPSATASSNPRITFMKGTTAMNANPATGPFLTLAEAAAVTGYSPSAFTDLAYNSVGNGPEEAFVPVAHLRRADGSLRALTREQLGDFPLSDDRLPGLLISAVDAHALVKWEDGASDRAKIQDEGAEWIAKLDYRRADW